MKYKYIAVDVDGTLLDDHDNFDHQRLAQDIEFLGQVGITFIIASGNSVDALHSLFGDDLVNNFVAENGGRIIFNGREILGHPHNRSVISNLFDFANQLPHVDLMSASGSSQTYIPREFSAVPVPFYPHHAYFDQLDQVREQIYNVNFSWHQQRLAQDKINAIVERINQQFPEVNATYSGAYGIDILPRGVNKAAGLQSFVKNNGGSLAEVVALGDTSNDIEMVQAAGLGIAMANATTDLKQVADRITAADNDHDGALKEIEQLFKLV